MPDKPDLRWKVKFKDNEFEFDPQTDITGRRLRQMKKWFGPDYGRYSNVLILLAQGDVDAWASAIWFCLDNAGLPKPSSPDMLDFPIGQLMTEALPSVSDDDDEDEVWDGEPQHASPLDEGTTPTSTPTSTGSGDGTSSS